MKSKSATQCIRPHLSCSSAELSARSGWSMALRQNDRPPIHCQQQWSAVSRHARYPARSPCSRDVLGMSRVGSGLPGLCCRLIGDHAARWQRMASYRYATTCWQSALSTPRRGLSHRHKDCQGDDWGPLGADRTRESPLSIYWTSSGKRSASLAADCDSDRSIGAKPAMTIVISSRRLHFPMRFTAEESGESLTMFQHRSNSATWSNVAWNNAVHWCGTARKVVCKGGGATSMAC